MAGDDWLCIYTALHKKTSRSLKKPKKSGNQSTADASDWLFFDNRFEINQWESSIARLVSSFLCLIILSIHVLKNNRKKILVVFIKKYLFGFELLIFKWLKCKTY